MPATLIVDTTGQICAWSREAEELLGYSALEAVGQSIQIIIPHHLRHRHSEGFARFVQTGISTLPEIVTTIALHKTGELMKLPISVKALRGDGKVIKAVEATFYPSHHQDPLFAFAGIWTTINGDRSMKSKPVPGPHQVYGFLTTSPNPPGSPPTARTTPMPSLSWPPAIPHKSSSLVCYLISGDQGRPNLVASN